MSLLVRSLSLSTCVSFLLFTTGCGMSNIAGSVGNPAAVKTISGRVHGGQQPVVGASIQLYAANTTTNKGASTAMLAQPASSGEGGNFDITGQYTCPDSNPLVYLVATGGNPGLSSGQSNTGIAEMALLGSCNDVINAGDNLFISLDEVATAVSVQAVAPFMADYAHIGSAPTSLNGIGEAFLTATDEIDFGNDQLNFSDSSFALPSVTLNTIADIIAACINSATGSSQCSSLYSNTGGTSNTIAATLAIVNAPGNNTAALYNLIPANPPFQPYFTSVPSDLTATVGYTLPAFTQGGTLDSNGRIWLYFGGYNYDTASDTSTDSAGYIVVYDSSFNQIFTVNPGTGGLYYPVAFAPDASGHVFAINSNNTVSEFGSNGAAISPSAGWPSGAPSTFSPSGPGNGYINNVSQVYAIGVDALGNIWGSSYYDPSGTNSNCYFELNSSGVNITPTGNFCSSTGAYGFDTFALDGSGSAWAGDSTSISKVDASGNLAFNAPISQGCFYPNSSLPEGSTIADTEGTTQTLLYDHVNNHLWGISLTGAGTITDNNAAVFCDSGSTVLPVKPSTSSASTVPGDPFSASSLLIANAALDGAGNLWFASNGITQTGVVGDYDNTFTGNATYASYLGEITAAGTLGTPYNTTTNTYGLQPVGFGTNVTAAATDGNSTPISESVAILGIDVAGNIWAVDSQSYKLLKITGMATPNTKNY